MVVCWGFTFFNEEGMNYTFFAIFALKLTLQNPSQFNNNNSNNNNNNTYIAPISILPFSSALKNKKISKKILKLHKVYMH